VQVVPPFPTAATVDIVLVGDVVVATLTTDVLRVVACYMYLISVCGPRIHWDAALTAVVVVGVAAGVDDAAEPPVM